MLSLKKILVGLIAIVSSQAHAHGEDVPGPHGGHIQMPGAFHTEVVQEKNGIRVYLLDIDWKNPTVTNSAVELTFVKDKNSTKIACDQEQNSFFCKMKISKKGTLGIQARRDGQSGQIAKYNLPLRFENSQKTKVKASATEKNNSHQGH